MNEQIGELQTQLALFEGQMDEQEREITTLRKEAKDKDTQIQQLSSQIEEFTVKPSWNTTVEHREPNKLEDIAAGHQLWILTMEKTLREKTAKPPGFKANPLTKNTFLSKGLSSTGTRVPPQAHRNALPSKGLKTG